MDLSLWAQGFFFNLFCNVAGLAAVAGAFWIAVPTAIRRYRKGADIEAAEQEWIKTETKAGRLVAVAPHGQGDAA